MISLPARKEPAVGLTCATPPPCLPLTNLSVSPFLPHSIRFLPHRPLNTGSPPSLNNPEICNKPLVCFTREQSYHGALSSPGTLVPQSEQCPRSPSLPPAQPLHKREKPFSVRLETLAHLWDGSLGPIATVFAIRVPVIRVGLTFSVRSRADPLQPSAHDHPQPFLTRTPTPPNTLSGRPEPTLGQGRKLESLGRPGSRWGSGRQDPTPRLRGTLRSGPQDSTAGPRPAAEAEVLVRTVLGVPTTWLRGRLCLGSPRGWGEGYPGLPTHPPFSRLGSAFSLFHPRKRTHHLCLLSSSLKRLHRPATRASKNLQEETPEASQDNFPQAPGQLRANLWWGLQRVS